MKQVKRSVGLFIFSLVEITIGIVSFVALIYSILSGASAKPLATVVFIFITSSLSLILGIGVFKRSIIAFVFLIYFASIIILSKIFIFAGIITLSGSLETMIPAVVKNIISIIYHSVLIWYFSLPLVRKEFGEDANVLFFVKKRLVK